VIESQRRHHSPRRGHHVRGDQLLVGEGGVAAPIRVIDDGVERLIQPLPEDHACGGLVEGHHAPSHDHVSGDLKRHPPQNEHLLAGVGVVGRVVEDFGAPEVLFGGAGGQGQFQSKEAVTELTLSCLPVSGDETVSIFETFATDEGIQGVGGFVEVFGATDEGVLVVAGFVDVDGDGDVFSHCSRLTVTSIIDS
jgi:hypothetical protein